MNDTPTSSQSKEEVALRDLDADDRLETLREMLAEFNLFDVLGVERSELRHSRVLGWLLDSRGSHGLSSSFLRGFLTYISSDGDRAGAYCVSTAVVKSWDLLDVETVRERQVREQDRIDILVVGKSDGFVCLIENKIDSEEHTNQLSRYLEVVEQRHPCLKVLPVFLTPVGAKPSKKRDAERYVSLGYQEIADLLRDVLAAQVATVNPSVAVFLEQYEQTLRRRILDTPSDIDTLALQVYSSHRDAVNRIIETKQRIMNVTNWAIDPAIAWHGPEDLLKDHHGNKHRRFYSKSLDGIQELRKGVRWTKSRRMALFEFMYREENHLTLTLMIGPGPQETRKRLWALGKRKNFKNSWNHERQFKGGRHFAIYVRGILNQQDFSLFDPGEARQKIEKSVSEFFEQDYCTIVNAIREEFGQDGPGPE